MTHEEFDGYESKSQMKRVKILKEGEIKMTHEELLAICDNYSFKDSAEPVKALRAVVELHKPEKFGQAYLCEACSRTYISYSEIYPCPTIQVIQENLK